MDEMVVCADEARHHWHSDKQVLLYLDVLTQTHAELANRAFDFITSHHLQAQFYEEKFKPAARALQPHLHWRSRK